MKKHTGSAASHGQWPPPSCPLKGGCLHHDNDGSHPRAPQEQLRAPLHQADAYHGDMVGITRLPKAMSLKTECMERAESYAEASGGYTEGSESYAEGC